MSPHGCLLVGWLVGRSIKSRDKDVALIYIVAKMNVGLTYICTYIHNGRPDSLLQTYTDGLTDKQIDL